MKTIKNFKIGLSLLFANVLLLLMLSACGGNASTPTTGTGFDTTPTPTEHSTFAKYAGDTFTISYPKAWTVLEKSGTTFHVRESPTTHFSVSVYDNDGDQLQQYIDSALAQYKDGSSEESFKTSAQQTVVISGQHWTQVTWKSDGGLSGYNFQGVVEAIYYNDKFYVIDYTAHQDQYNEIYNKTFYPMEQSFAFSA